MIDPTMQVLSFTVGEFLLAIPLRVIVRVIHAVYATPLPMTPETIPGVIDYHGTVVPVLDLRKRLGITAVALHPANRFIIAHLHQRKIALVVDEIRDILSAGTSQAEPLMALFEQSGMEGIGQDHNGMFIIYDPEKFLSSIDLIRLDEAIRKQTETKLHT